MDKKRIKKLRLSKKTIRNLEDQKLAEAQGGAWTDSCTVGTRACSSCTRSCTVCCM